MRARVVTALLALALALAGCESSASPAPVTVAPVEAWPAGDAGSHHRAGCRQRGL